MHRLPRRHLRSLDAVTAETAATPTSSRRLRAADAARVATALVAGADRFVTNNRRDFPRSLVRTAYRCLGIATQERIQDALDRASLLG
jgi:hypothetical protein